MIEEHGLVSVETVLQHKIPAGAHLFADVNGTLRFVTGIFEDRYSLRLTVKSPRKCEQKRGASYDQLLVVSYKDLDGELAEPIIRRSRLVRLPFRQFEQQVVEDTKTCSTLHYG